NSCHRAALPLLSAHSPQPKSLSPPPRPLILIYFHLISAALTNTSLTLAFEQFFLFGFNCYEISLILFFPLGSKGVNSGNLCVQVRQNSVCLRRPCTENGNHMLNVPRGYISSCSATNFDCLSCSV